jgi:hypothetical protein
LAVERFPAWLELCHSFTCSQTVAPNVSRVEHIMISWKVAAAEIIRKSNEINLTRKSSQLLLCHVIVQGWKTCGITVVYSKMKENEN